jgi:hypothetical protein
MKLSLRGLIAVIIKTPIVREIRNTKVFARLLMNSPFPPFFFVKKVIYNRISPNV